MAVVVGQIHRGVIGAWRHSTVASLHSLVSHLKDVAMSEGNIAGAEVEAMQDAIFERETSPQAGDNLTPPSPSQDVTGIQARLRVLKKEEHRLHDNLIPTATWQVLNRLHEIGYESYLVGGSVRDLLLNQIPKDFDVLSTAEPIEIKKSFRGRCIIVGKRFPICHVNSMDSVIEVSSFSTNSHNKETVAAHGLIEGTKDWGERDFARWKNAFKRDFTINGLMYDPFLSIVYDYVGGLRDLKKLKVRTVIPADESFQEDSARILRAIRIAARLEFTFTRSTARAILDHKLSLLDLNKTRLQLEANMMLAYGASERSVRLLWKYGILEYLFPLQAQYFEGRFFKRRDSGTNLLLELLANLDKATSPNHPCHGGLWAAVLAFHLALINRRRRPVAVSAVALAMYHEEGLSRALVKARRIHERADREATTVWSELASETAEMDEVTLDDCKGLLNASLDYLSHMSSPSITGQAMHTLTGDDPASDRVVVSRPYFYRAVRLFQRANAPDEEEEQRQSRDRKIESPDQPGALTRGNLEELSFVFSRIVLNTLYPNGVKNKNTSAFS